MKLIKLFDYREVGQDTGIDLLEYWGDNAWDVCNDTAVSWYIEDSKEDTDETYYKIDQYFISKGCTKDERVLIDVSW